MNFELYKQTLTYPTRVTRPKIDLYHLTPDEAAERVRTQQKLEDQHRAEIQAYRDETTRLQALFRKDALEEVGLTNHPRADKAFAYAWQLGSSDGYWNVLSHLEEIADILIGD